MIWESAAAVHVLGEELWARALSRGCPPTMANRVIPPAVDLAFFTPVARRNGALGTPGRPLRLLSVARLHWKKGLVDIATVDGRLRDAGLAVEHRIVGDGPDRQELEAAIDDQGLGGSVVLLGRRDRRTVRDELHRADVLVHPSVSEGFANAVVEAQATGLPVVCSDADGLRENVDDGATGFVVARRDPMALGRRHHRAGRRRRPAGEDG